MFKSIADFFQEKISPKQETIDEQHLTHLAAAALLLEVSRADFEIQDKELKEIANALQRRFKFNEEEVQNLLNLALTEQEAHVSIYPFVKIINEGCSPEEKKLLLEDLWHVAYADNKLDKYEDYQKAVRLIESGQVKTEPLFSKHFDFEQFPEAYAFIDEQRDKTMKVFIDL